MIEGNISTFSVKVNTQKVNELTLVCGQVGFEDNAGTLRAAYVQHILTVRFRIPRTLNRPSRVGWRKGGGRGGAGGGGIHLFVDEVLEPHGEAPRPQTPHRPSCVHSSVRLNLGSSSLALKQDLYP